MKDPHTEQYARQMGDGVIRFLGATVRNDNEVKMFIAKNDMNIMFLLNATTK